MARAALIDNNNVVTNIIEYDPELNFEPPSNLFLEVLDINDKVEIGYQLVNDVWVAPQPTPDPEPIPDPLENFHKRLVAVENNTNTISAWIQPEGAHDAYPADAKVTHNNKTWNNIHGDGNVWEPGVYGWEEVV